MPNPTRTAPFVDLPLDVISIILVGVDPKTLIVLTQVCRDIRNFLLHKCHERIWTEARASQRVPIPPPPPTIPDDPSAELYWALLLFKRSPICQTCRKRRVKPLRPNPVVGRYISGPCIRQSYFTSTKVKALAKKKGIRLKLNSKKFEIKDLFVTMTGHVTTYGIHPHFYKPDVNEVLDILAHKRARDRVEFIKIRLEFAHKLREYIPVWRDYLSGYCNLAS